MPLLGGLHSPLLFPFVVLRALRTLHPAVSGNVSRAITPLETPIMAALTNVSMKDIHIGFPSYHTGVASAVFHHASYEIIFITSKDRKSCAENKALFAAPDRGFDRPERKYQENYCTRTRACFALVGSTTALWAGTDEGDAHPQLLEGRSPEARVALG